MCLFNRFNRDVLIEVNEDKNQIEYIVKIWMKNHAKIKYYFYGELNSHMST